jgi:hypothetical protein
MANIFLAPRTLSPEDHLTASWEYALDSVRGLGQAFLNHVTARSGLPPSTFTGAIRHPPGTARDRPDFLIRCRHYDLLFEHKLESPLGARQLERYLALARSGNQRLALVAAQRMTLPSPVYRSSSFVCPKETGSPSHFLWQDIYPIVRGFRGRIARDFAEYLKHLGLASFKWPGQGDPFTDPKAADALRRLYDRLTPELRRPGASCRTRSSSLIYEIRRPVEPPVHLVNLGPLNSVAAFDPRLWGPVMAAWVWVQGPASRTRPVLPLVYGHIEHTRPRVLVSDTLDSSRDFTPQILRERIYYVPLGDILLRSEDTSFKRLLSFAHAVLDNLRGARRVVNHA